MSHDKGAIKWQSESGAGLSLTAKPVKLGLPITSPTASATSRRFRRAKQAVAFSNKAGVEISEGRHVADSVSITVAEAAAIWIKAVELGRGDNPPAENGTLRPYRSQSQAPHSPGNGQAETQSANASECCHVP